MAVPKMSFGFSFIFLHLVLQLLISSFPQYEALATGNEVKKGKDRVLNPKKSNKMTLEKMTSLMSKLKVYQGINTQVPAMLMLMESSPYYLWEYYSAGLIMSATCALIRAYDVADTSNYPPTVYTDYYHTLYIPRYGCDANHHIQGITFSDPPYDPYTQVNDIAVATTKRKIQFGNEACGGQPVAPTWVSCDPDGPPAGYTDCKWAAYGLKNSDGPWWSAAPEEISPNANSITILDYQQCEQSRIDNGESVPYVPESEICGSLPDGTQPYCPYDRNGALFCKYWKPVNNSYPGGWAARENNEATPKKNKAGWSAPQTTEYVAVGHQTWYYGTYCPNKGAALFIKFGTPNYKSMFGVEGCGFKCSSDLSPGEKCKGNPSPSLGPVYCIPEPAGGGWGAQPPSSGWGANPPSSGWGANPSSGWGWEETPTNTGWSDEETVEPLPNGWEGGPPPPTPSGWGSPPNPGWGSPPNPGWGSPPNTGGWGAPPYKPTGGWAGKS